MADPKRDPKIVMSGQFRTLPMYFSDLITMTSIFKEKTTFASESFYREVER